MSDGDFEQVLRDRRERLNRVVADARRGGRGVDAEVLLRLLDTLARPAVEAVAARRAERGGATCEALLAVLIDLLAASAVGPSRRTEAVHRLWLDALPALAEPLGRDPRPVAAALSNAVLRVDHDGRVDEFLAGLAERGSRAADTAQLLDLGRVLAWTAGLPRLRPAALDALERLPADLIDLGDVAALRADPWHGTATTLHAVGTVGDFVGLGGVFARPPVAVSAAGRVQVSDGASTWAVVADRFGRTLVRDAAVPPAKTDVNVAGGRLRFRDETVDVSVSENITSAAADTHLAAVTAADSFRVYLFARAAE